MAQNLNEFAHNWEVAQELVGSVCPHLSTCKISSSGLHCVGCISHEQLRTQGDMTSKSQKYLEYKAHDQQVRTRRNLHVTVKGPETHRCWFFLPFKVQIQTSKASVPIPIRIQDRTVIAHLGHVENYSHVPATRDSNVGSCLGPVPGDCWSQSGPVPPGQHAKGARVISKYLQRSHKASPLPK